MLTRVVSSSNMALYRLSPLCLSNVKGRSFSTSTAWRGKANRHKVVIVGAGSGGCSVAAKLARKLGPSNVAVIEPAQTHYYQPLWTLVGGGLKSLADSGRPMSSVLPSGITWIKDKASSFNPNANKVATADGREIEYEYLVIAMGIQLKYDAVKGLPEALNTPGVCSNYSPLHVNKTFEAIKNFEKGNAVFTLPNTPIKCAGAPQKILYLAQDYFRKHNKLQDTNLIYCTSLGVLFGVKHYADALWPIIKERNIQVNLRHDLVEVIAKEKKAIFQNLDKPNERKTIEYSMLHVTPPMGPYPELKDSSQDLCDPSGYVNVNKQTLQHAKYENIFALGDCTNLPTSKTAAAVAAQNGILVENMLAVMNNKEPGRHYDGYTSCPLVTSDHTCILAEFDYSGQPLETFPINQAKERTSMYYLKSLAMPSLYWHVMLKGYWNGPGLFRKLMHLGMK